VFREEGAKRRLSGLFVAVLFVGTGGIAWAEDDFNQAADHQVDHMGYYHALTTGEQGEAPEGGIFRYITDDPDWDIPIDEWQARAWFPQNTGLAMTLWRDDAIVWRNHGIETAQTGTFYQAAADSSGELSQFTPGLTSFYSMSNNYDMIYAAYVKIAEPVTFDRISGYFTAVAGFDPHSPRVSYRMNIWTVVRENGVAMPGEVSFTGNVFATDDDEDDDEDVEPGADFTDKDADVDGDFDREKTEVERVWTELDREAEPIWRLTFTPEEPFTLPPGEYFFSHDAVIHDPLALAFVSPVAGLPLLALGGDSGGPGFIWWPLGRTASGGGAFVPPPSKTVVPEPATGLLLGIGVAGVSGVAWLRRRKQQRKD
jgi:hypothetical protein